MDQVIVIGSINMDTTLSVPHIPVIGETILVSDINYNSGGKGANQAMMVGTLGGRVAMLGSIGDDKNGIKLMNNFKKSNVNTDRILVKKNENSGFAIVNVSDNGDNNILVYPGANKKISKEDIDKNIDIIKSSIYCILQLEISYEIVKYVIDICNRNNTKVILNPAPGRKIEDEILEKVDFLIPNKSELEIISGEEINEQNILHICNKIINKGCNNIIATLGDKGCLFVNNKTYKHYMAETVTVVDTTGAGDAFIGAFVYMLSDKQTIDESIKFATKIASLTVQKRGAQNSIKYINEN